VTLDELKKTYTRKPGKKIYRKVKDKSISSSTDPATYTLKFGCHKGVALKDVPIDYLHWVITQVDSRPDVVELVKKFLGVPRDIFFVCAQTVANVYAEASKMDVTTLSKEDALRYQQTMDVTRRMQAVLDNDKGKGSPRAQEALRALMASWASNIAAMCAAPLYGLLCVPGVPWCPRSGRIGGGVLLSTCGTRKVPQS
jgi:hypothetical protein